MQPFQREQLEILVKLQEIETESYNIKSMLSAVKDKLEKLDVGLKNFKETIEDEEDHLNELNRRDRTYESDVQLSLSKIKKSEEKLRSVKTNKEYQMSLKEIEDLKTINSQIEDQMLECLDQIEASENLVASKKKEYLRFSDQTNHEKEKIGMEITKGKKTLMRLDKERVVISKNLEPEFLKKFQMIKEQQVTGIAVVPVKDAVCLGCNMNIPPQMYNELQRCDSLKLCPYCQRIIYWKEF